MRGMITDRDALDAIGLELHQLCALPVKHGSPIALMATDRFVRRVSEILHERRVETVAAAMSDRAA